MASTAKKDAPLRIELPPAKADRALTSKVGIVAVVGFALGVAWPRMVGFKPGPDAPGANAPSTPSNRPAVAPPGAGSSADADAAASASAPDDARPTNQQQVVVGDGAVIACAGKKGDKIKDCGRISFDKIAKSRLAELARCPAAIGLEGKMWLGLTLNFEKDEVVIDGEKKKKSGLPSDTVRGVSSCASAELKGVELDKIPHTHQKYSLVYELSFYPPGKSPPEPAAAGAASADAEEEAGLGRATVTWEKALVRETPPEGNVVFRLPQGTRVKLLELKDGWYRIETGKGKGWVYHQAIGK